MKLTLLLTLVSFLTATADVLAQRVDLQIENASLKSVLMELAKQSGYAFVFNEEEIAQAVPVSIHVKNKEVHKVLPLVFEGQTFSYELKRKVVTVTPRVIKTPNIVQQHHVTGKVISAASGAAIEGVTVTNKRSRIHAVTDRLGEYRIAARPDDILVYSFVGYVATVEEIGGRGKITVALDSAEYMLEEVEINTGYQKIRPERFVGSAEVMDSAAFHRRAGMGIIGRLDGTVPGLVFDKKMGTSDLFQIRGVSTLGGTYSDPNQQKPLIVLDNFPFDGSLADINPNDVASVTVLKDAAAASIWGSRAGNGVVVITTKTGKFNQPGRLTVRSNIGFDEEPDLFYYPRISSASFVEIERFLYDRGYFDADLANQNYPFGWPAVSPVVELLDRANKGLIDPNAAETEIDELARLDFRNELAKHWYRPAFRQQHYVDFSGGGEKHAFSVSTGYNSAANSISRADGRKGFTLTTNNIFRPLDGLQVTANLNYSLTDDRTPAQLPLGEQYPYQRLVNPDGTPAIAPTMYRMAYIDTAGAGQLLDWHLRPLKEVSKAENLNRQQLLRLGIGINYRLLRWLQAEMRYQYVNRRTDGRDHYSVDMWHTRDLINRFTNLSETTAGLRYPVPMGGILELGTGSQGSNRYRLQLRANNNWGQNHMLSAMLATEVAQTNQKSHNSRLYGYNDEYGTYQSNIDFQRVFPMYNAYYSRNSVPAAAGYREAYLNRTISVLGNAAYTYRNRYNLYLSARRDGSNLFGVKTNNKWKPLWSVGGSWEISRERLKLPAFVSQLRVRGSYGYTGNVNNSVSGYPTMSYLPVTSRSLNELPAAQMQSPPNPSLRWEQVRIINGGLDFQLISGRISGSAEWFNKKSTDLISAVPFDPTTGVFQYTVNAASLMGNGFDISLNSLNVTGRIRWETALNLSYAKMKVTKVYDGGFRARDFISYGLQPAEGKVAYGISSYQWAGLDPQTGDPMGFIDGSMSKDYTSIFNDTVSNQRFHGSAIPLYSGFLTNTFHWRAFSLSMNLTYRMGFYFRQPALRYNSLFNGNGLHADYNRRWKQPGDEQVTNVPSMLYPVPSDVALRDDFYAGSEIHVKRGDNLRIQDVRIAYRVSALRKGNITVFAYGNNLNIILWKAYDGRLDANYTGGNDSSAAPVPRSWTIGVNIEI